MNGFLECKQRVGSLFCLCVFLLFPLCFQLSSCSNEEDKLQEEFDLFMSNNMGNE